jgi:hypothetical protein
LPTVAGDHSPPAKKLPKNNTSNTQVGNLCVFKTMEWLAKYLGANINSGTFLQYYVQNGGGTLAITDGFSGQLDQLNSLINHFFDAVTCSSIVDAINAGDPVMADIPVNGSQTDGHEVMITGYNNDGTYEYFDPQSGTYKSAPLATFTDAMQIYGKL